MSDTSTLPESLQQTLSAPERARIAWLLAALRPSTSGFDPAQTTTAFAENFNPRRAESVLTFLGQRGARLGAFRFTDVVRDAEDVIEVRLVDDRARPWALRARVRADAPHLIDLFSLGPALPTGAVWRDATEADGPAIERIETGSGIERADGTRVTAVLGPRLFELTHLMEEGRLGIVEIDGEPAALDACALRRVRHDGREVRLAYRHHTRVLPAYRRLGLNEAMGARFLEISQTRLRSEFNAVHIDPNNTVIKEWSGLPAWTVRPFRALLSCAALAGPPAGHQANVDDARFAAGCLNASHEREALFLPYTAASLDDRLCRRPGTYGWPQLLLGRVAVLGIWNPAERVVVETGDARIERRRAFVLDYGCLGNEGVDELERLIRSSCADLNRQGITHLSIFSSPSSPAEALLRRLAEQVVEVEFQSALPEPPDAMTSGVYVDHLYF